MKISLGWDELESVSGDLVFVPVFEEAMSAKNRPAQLAALNEKLEGLLLRLAELEGFQGRVEQLFVLHTHGKLAAVRVSMHVEEGERLIESVAAAIERRRAELSREPAGRP